MFTIVSPFLLESICDTDIYMPNGRLAHKKKYASGVNLQTNILHYETLAEDSFSFIGRKRNVYKSMFWGRKQEYSNIMCHLISSKTLNKYALEIRLKCLSYTTFTTLLNLNLMVALKNFPTNKILRKNII